MPELNNDKQAKVDEVLDNFKKKLKNIESETLKKIHEIMKTSDKQKASQALDDIKKII